MKNQCVKLQPTYHSFICQRVNFLKSVRDSMENNNPKDIYSLFEVRSNCMDNGSRLSFCIGDIIMCRSIPREKFECALDLYNSTMVIIQNEYIFFSNLLRYDPFSKLLHCYFLNESYKGLVISLDEVTELYFTDCLVHRNMNLHMLSMTKRRLKKESGELIYQLLDYQAKIDEIILPSSNCIQ